MSQYLFSGYSTFSIPGVRNEVVVFATDALIHNISKKISENINQSSFLYHPYGRGQIGADKVLSRRITENILTHPNLLGSIIVSYEQNDLKELENFILEQGKKVSAISVYQSGGRTEAIRQGMEAAANLVHEASQANRTEFPLDQLKVGFIFDTISNKEYIPVVLHTIHRLSELGIQVYITETNGRYGIDGQIQETKNIHVIEDYYGYPEETIALLGNAHCQLFIQFGQTLTTPLSIVPNIHVCFQPSSVGFDLVLNHQDAVEQSVEQIITKLRSIASGEKTFSEILNRGFIWYPRIEMSI